MVLEGESRARRSVSSSNGIVRFPHQEDEMASRSIRRTFVALGQRMLQVDLADHYGKGMPLIHTGQGAVVLPQPGFVGEAYPGLVIIGSNPGRGKNRAKAHRCWNDALGRWRAEGTIDAYRAVHELWLRDREAWNAWRDWVAPVLLAANLTAENIAYVNMVKMPTAKNKARPDAVLVDTDWPWTRRQLHVLKPVVVLVGGIGISEALFKKWSEPDAVVLVQNRYRRLRRAQRRDNAQRLGTEIRRLLAD